MSGVTLVALGSADVSAVLELLASANLPVSTYLLTTTARDFWRATLRP